MKVIRPLADETIERLGTYFVYFNIYQRYGITFETFLDRWARGIYDDGI